MPKDPLSNRTDVKRTDKERKIVNDFRVARYRKTKWIDEAVEDFEFKWGRQWDPVKKDKLEKRGVRALTINKIQSYVHLICGIQRQNRTDFLAFPEGEEDSLVSNIATLLLKNTMKRTGGEYKLSEMFEDGVICGESHVEPHLDYTYDLLTGEMKFSKKSPFETFIDPASKEYDLSDAEYRITVATDISKDQLYQLFPEKKKEIDKIKNGKLAMDKIVSKEVGDFYDNEDETWRKKYLIGEDEKKYDLLTYQYKNYIRKYLVADKGVGQVQEAKDKAEADKYKVMADNLKKETLGEGVEWTEDMSEVVVIERVVPEIWTASMIGDEKIIEDKRSWTYPKWRSYTGISFFAYRTTIDLKDRELMVQGVVRSLKDPQREVNKRRTQELRHLNSTANSGWLTEKDAWVDKSQVKKQGATPGVTLEYKKGYTAPEPIYPKPLSAGHEKLVELATQDMREISGVNVETLALSDKSVSGRAIMLRQRQGIVMLQSLLDNWSQTKRILGKFLLSQLSELYTVETAIKVLGSGFIEKNFKRPVMSEDGVTPLMDQQSGEMIMEVDDKLVGETINKVLNDAELGRYDVAIGEGSHTDTVKYANYELLVEMLEKGVPIPPEVVIEESLLTDASKIKIKEAIRLAQEAAEAAAAQGGERK